MICIAPGEADGHNGGARRYSIPFALRELPLINGPWGARVNTTLYTLWLGVVFRPFDFTVQSGAAELALAGGS